MEMHARQGTKVSFVSLDSITRGATSCSSCPNAPRWCRSFAWDDMDESQPWKPKMAPGSKQPCADRGVERKQPMGLEERLEIHQRQAAASISRLPREQRELKPVSPRRATFRHANGKLCQAHSNHPLLSLPRVCVRPRANVAQDTARLCRSALESAELHGATSSSPLLGQRAFFFGLVRISSRS